MCGKTQTHHRVVYDGAVAEGVVVCWMFAVMIIV